MNIWPTKQFPRYFVTKTLIGGEPDCNRRHIVRGDSGIEVWRRVPGPNGWSKEDQAACDAELERLYAEPAPRYAEPETGR